jgi:hypothetical protein
MEVSRTQWDNGVVIHNDVIQPILTEVRTSCDHSFNGVIKRFYDGHARSPCDYI